ncbi:ScbA/BarX family gamma-butyrolactone biosynthesis protein [Kitasatospora sp. NPDC056184]|uniref:ScbA/BarX family gamma-butyrolactone biosynthesis protein n=1 Tax=Kitasatospora sp. NPDC056184 TaxID=3345738 RepID=UPI0035DEADE4
MNATPELLRLRDSGESRHAGPVAELSFDSTVPRALVHRTAIAEVFVTDSARVGDPAPESDEHTFEVAAQLPRGHVVGERGGSYDFLLLVEVLRQSGVLVAHQYLEVPLDRAFIFSALNLTISGLEALRIGPRPAHAVLSTTVRPKRNPAGRVLGFDFTGTFWLDGVPAITGSGALTFVTNRAFQMLRAGNRKKLDGRSPRHPQLLRSAPSLVGRRDAFNIVLTEPSVSESGTASALLVVDTGHPHLFDHQLDHVPGNLQLEAARQLSVAAVAKLHGLPAESLVVTAARAEFTDFAELDLVTRAVAEVGDASFDGALGAVTVPVGITVSQEGNTVAALAIEVTQWS